MTEDLKATTRKLWEEIWPDGDVEALTAVLHPDSVNHEAPPGTDAGVEGAVQTMLWLQAAFSDQRYEIHQIIAEGDTIAVFLTHHGRHTGDFMGIPPTGRTFSYRHVHILRFEDGRSIEHWAVRDDAALIRQLQAIPSPVS